MAAAYQNAPLTAEQEALVRQLKAEVAHIVEEDAALQSFCIDHTYVRYLRARGWNLQKASKMLQATLAWRKETKPHLIRFADVKEESVTGKNFLYPAFDKHGRPVILMRPRFENTKTSDRQVHYLVYLLEMASRIADKLGVGKMAWLLDFEGYSTSNAPPMRTSMNCLSILQNHYPERLGNAVCFHAPYLFSLTWKAVRPFVDPVTQNKILFSDKGAAGEKIMADMFHMDKMEECMGGKVPNYVFNVATFEAECQKHEVEVAEEIAQLQKKAKEEDVSFIGLAPSSSSKDLEVTAQAQKLAINGETTLQEVRASLQQAA